MKSPNTSSIFFWYFLKSFKYVTGLYRVPLKQTESSSDDYILDSPKDLEKVGDSSIISIVWKIDSSDEIKSGGSNEYTGEYSGGTVVGWKSLLVSGLTGTGLDGVYVEKNVDGILYNRTSTPLSRVYYDTSLSKYILKYNVSDEHWESNTLTGTYVYVGDGSENNATVTFDGYVDYDTQPTDLRVENIYNTMCARYGGDPH